MISIPLPFLPLFNDGIAPYYMINTDIGATLAELNCKSIQRNILASSFNELCWKPLLRSKFVSDIIDSLFRFHFPFLPLFNDGMIYKYTEMIETHLFPSHMPLLNNG